MNIKDRHSMVAVGWVSNAHEMLSKIRDILAMLENISSEQFGTCLYSNIALQIHYVRVNQILALGHFGL